MKLCHLFPDLMNLYGDRGNLRLLERRLTQAGLAVQTVPVAPGQTPDLGEMDLIYMGPGTEPALRAALDHLRPLAAGLRAALEAGRPMLFTGNSWLGLGRSLITPEGETLAGLGLFDFAARLTHERLTADTVAILSHDDLPATPVVGFQNRCDQVEGVTTPLFSALMGPGNAPDSPWEGLREGNLLATHLTGPILVKNPQLLAWVADALGAEALPPDPEAELAYQTTLKALEERMG